MILIITQTNQCLSKHPSGLMTYIPGDIQHWN